MGVLDRIMLPCKDTLTPGTCDCITFHGQRDFADMIKSLEIQRLPWNSQYNHMGPYKREVGGSQQDWKMLHCWL